MTSGLKRERRISPMPIKSILTPPDMRKTYCEPTTYVLTAEQLAEVIEKYGAPTMPLSSRRQAMHMQRPNAKKKVIE